jgi:signal transduction histidine kinase
MRFLINKRNCVIYLILIIAGVFISDIVYKGDIKYRREANSFTRKLRRLEREGIKVLSEIKSKESLSRDYIAGLKEISESKGLSFASYKDGKLELWSESTFELPENSSELDLDKPFRFIQNRWVLSGYTNDSAGLNIYFIDIYDDYSIENNLIKSGFRDSFGLNPGTEFTIEPERGYPVYSLDGEYVFSIAFDKNANFNTWFVVIPIILWILFFIVSVSLINTLTESITRNKESRAGVYFTLALSVIFYTLFILTGKPEIISNLSIFSPYRYTAGKLFPSPGHILLANGFLIYIAYSFYRWWPIRSKGSSGARRQIAFAVYLIPAALMFYLFNLSMESFINSSNISFEFYKILDIDSFTIVSFLASSSLILVMLIYLIKVFVTFSEISPSEFIVALAPSVAIVIIIYIIKDDYPLIHLLAFALIVAMIWIFRNRKSVIVVSSVTLSLIAGAYSAWFISSEMWDTETEKVKVMAVGQIGNNDPVAEELLIDNWDRLKNDTVLSPMMNLEFFIEGDVAEIYNYLDTEYFNGYWQQYDIFYTVCNWDSPLLLETSEKEVLCFEFFNSRLEEYGIPLIDSSLYLIDNRSGRPYYLATLFFDQEDGVNKGGRTGLFIDLISKLVYDQPGYPELLKDKKYQSHSLPKDYSMAKYIGDSLVLETGNYPFPMTLQHDSIGIGEFISFIENDHDCMVYNHSPTVSVVIARPVMKFHNVLINFTYIFIVFFVLFTIIMMILSPPERINLRHLDFRQKLQYAFLLLLLGSIFAIGAVVISLSISQYRGKHYDSISEKLSSVYIELDHKLSTEEQLTSEWSQDTYQDLDALLVKFSNVFFTDLNLYTVDGNLLASSRREVFDKDLKGKRMDYRAFTELNYFGESRFIQEEKVGELTYLSAYSPFLNYRNEVLAYLNLPYFAIQNELSEEISNLVVTIVNFSLLLIVISMGFAVFIALQITSPLRMLKEGLASVSLDSESTRLEYSGHDEISELVNQYNDMLEQLHLSAIKLARSEREDAWRDMAKQIAHEIKNPLTPMKLNVQQLLKTWKDNPGDFEARIEKFSENMIENIDNLSSIATEFSDFARMPKANPKKMNLVAYLKSSVDLFENTSNVDIICNCQGLEEVFILADKEQIKSMLTNVIRNAVQAIPSNKAGRVEVSLEISGRIARISIKDNGVGVPDSVGEKLFMPTFTTKSSGMGIGLAIVKRIVESARGSIKYKSRVDRGTTFFIEFPILSTSGN